MKNILFKFGIPFMSAVVGGLIVAAATTLIQSTKPISAARAQESAAETLIRQQQEMRKNLMNSFFSDPFAMNSAFPRVKTEPVITNSIQKREDDHFVYFDVSVPDPTAANIKTELKDGYLTISGKSESNVKSEEGQEAFTSEFAQTLPLPTYVDAKGMRTEADQNKLVIKFPKILSDKMKPSTSAFTNGKEREVDSFI